MTVDPKVRALAAAFVDDVLFSVIPPLMSRGSMPPDREALIVRAAEAMQQAIEDECDAIRQELEEGVHRGNGSMKRRR